MGQISYDDLLQSYEDSGISLCPVGTHDVKVIKAEYGQTSTGRDQFVVTYELVGGPNAGRTLRHWMTIVPEYPGLVRQWFMQMEAMGLDKAYFQAKPTNEKVCADLVGRTCRIEVGRRPKRGGSGDEETEDIKKVSPPLDGAAAPVPVVMSPIPAVAAPPVASQFAADPTAPVAPF